MMIALYSFPRTSLLISAQLNTEDAGSVRLEVPYDHRISYKRITKCIH